MTRDSHSAPSGATYLRAFTPAAIMARARAHGADQVARAGAFEHDSNLRSPAEVLAALAAGIDAQAPEPPRPAPGAPSADALLDGIARELDGSCR